MSITCNNHPYEQQPINATVRQFLRILLGMLLILTTARLIGFVLRFATESLQMDFRRLLYTAGEAH